MKRAFRLALSLAVLFGAAPAFPAEKKPLTRIAFGSCAGHDLPQPFWDEIRKQNPEVFLFLGDNVYADTFDPFVLRQIYSALAAKEPFQRFRAEVPILATWDDHDYGNNDAGAEHPRKWDAQGVFLDFFGVPKDSPRRNRAGVYHAEVFGPPGKRVQIILLDTRFHRSKLKQVKEKPRTFRLNEQPRPYIANMARDATFLGMTQWKWLKAQLKVPAEIRIICSSIQVVPETHDYEKWANIPAERTRLLETLRSAKAEAVFVLSGDRHHAEVSVLKNGLGPGSHLYDVTSSSLNKPVLYDPRIDRKLIPDERNAYRVGPLVHDANFGMVLVDWAKTPPAVTFEIRDSSGAVRVSEQVPFERMAPKPSAIAQ